MKCLRCGYCCVMLDVIIVKPEFANRDLIFDQLEDHMLIHKPFGEKCPHLEINKQKLAVCRIHEFEWYKQTPCFAYTQIERSPDNLCRMGEYVMKNPELRFWTGR